ncbi:hypothetical protein B9Z55_019066 [Caenorhabditis nigoni]|uniref:Uncharacterized protein n=1 Tax=Caenorhabditis nigoni TaxID=1611254 RepID=A0A2G5TH08_9PELO|nr:hypothetical protein B9Z55_019066 [Caenorhabditis nigoni]
MYEKLSSESLNRFSLKKRISISRSATLVPHLAHRSTRIVSLRLAQNVFAQENIRNRPTNWDESNPAKRLTGDNSSQ